MSAIKMETPQQLVHRRMMEMFGTDDLLLLMEKGYYHGDSDILSPIGDSLCRISGSFLLQCIYQETWAKSDIDVFSPKCHLCVESCKYLGDYCGHAYINLSLSTKDKTFDFQNIVPGNPYEELPICPRMYKFLDRVDVNDIRLSEKCTSAEAFIDQFFDLDICKIVYNPKTGRLKMRDVDVFFTKSMTYAFDLVKYSFGFPKSEHFLLQKQIQRIQKYRSRGFQIFGSEVVQSRYDEI